MAKYPGSFIINEVGTRKELAGLYGVSERTIYRWLAKAAKESGLTPKPKKSMPAPKALAAFKGTRKQLAAKYGVSERTAYRWLAKIRGSSDIPYGSVNRSKMSKYPGINILNMPGKNKELAEQFGVSDRTISRWKRKARLEETATRPEQTTPTERTPKQTTFEDFFEEAYTPENIIEPPAPEEPEDIFEEPIEDVGEPWEVPEYDYYADDRPEWEKLGLKEEQYAELVEIINIITENKLLVEGSKFNNLESRTTILFMNDYIDYLYNEVDPSMFYDEETHQERFDSEWVSALPIWGEEFEHWLELKIEVDSYEI